MDRDYKTGKSDSVGVFSGLEVEHTPAYGKQTLFLARNDLYFDQIEELAKKVNAEAIYFGANRTFMYNHATQINQMMRLLRKGYYVTIDYPHSIHNEVKKRFENIVSIQTKGKNIGLKINIKNLISFSPVDSIQKNNKKEMIRDANPKTV